MSMEAVKHRVATTKKGRRPIRSSPQPTSGRSSATMSAQAENSPPISRALAPMALPRKGRAKERKAKLSETSSRGR